MDSQLDQEKKFYERFYALLNDKDLMKLLKKFGPGILRRSSVLEGFDEFLQAKGFAGKTCLEIGTLNGLTAIVLSRYFDKVITIDIVPGEAEKLADYLKIKNIEFVLIKDNKEKAAVISKLNFDAAYIDGNHAHDTETDFALVKKCGKVLFHEHWEPQPAVMNLVKGLGGVTHKDGKFALWID